MHWHTGISAQIPGPAKSSPTHLRRDPASRVVDLESASGPARAPAGPAAAAPAAAPAPDRSQPEAASAAAAAPGHGVGPPGRAAAARHVSGSRAAAMAS
jgi:hypothetical protein